MEIFEEVGAVIEIIKGAKPVPFSASAMINKQELLDRLERLRRDLPEELTQARHVMAEREQMADRLQERADELLVEAQAERDRLVSKTEIVDAANQRAAQIMEAAKQRALQLKAEAEDYVDSRLASFEVVLQKTLGVVTNGRDSLKGRLDVAGQVVPQDEPEPYDPDKSDPNII